VIFADEIKIHSHWEIVPENDESTIGYEDY